jgi:nitrogen regulatory protein PII
MHLDDFHQKARIEIVAPDALVERIVSTISAAAHTGNDGDGKVFVWAVEHAMRIQTGETDESAV